MSVVFSFTRRFFWPILIFVVLILLCIAYGAGRASVYQANPGLAQAEQANSILAHVGKFMQLPSETPTMATIKDAASAKAAQPFLVNAENGDVLIVFQQAAEAILYRPSTDKIISVGPVSPINVQNAGTNK